MSSSPIARQVEQLSGSLRPLFAQVTQSRWAQRKTEPTACDFVLGNPHEMPLPEFVDAIRRWSVPEHKDWFAYKLSEPEAQRAVVEALRQRRGIAFEPEDVTLTNGAFGALAVSLRAVLDPGDEVIFLSPPWFFYDLLIRAAGAEPVRVSVDRESFDLDLAAIQAAITPRTRGILVNTPHNPTGVIYPPESLRGLATLLEDASRRNGRTIYLFSDEAYSRIVFDGQPFHSPTAFYPSTFLLYTFGKTLLTPGERLGYVVMPPTMPDREMLRTALTISQLMNGYAVPNGVLQFALPELEQMSIDIAHLQRKRDRMVPALREMGYQVTRPQGTFYLVVKSPWPDDQAFCDLLAEDDVFVLPGAAAEMPGFFRISLTANDAMIERALPIFAAAHERAAAATPAG